MKIYHLNCGTMCPIGGSFMDGFSKGLTSKLACHCLAIETNDGLVLVDTGFGIEDIRRPHQRLSEFFIYFNNIQFNSEDTALRKIQRLGFRKEDVRHIVITHLDFDHAGGISDFPNAKVHLLKAELDAALHPKSWLDRNRYRLTQLESEKNWVTYNTKSKLEGDSWFGFKCVRSLEGLPPELLLIPLTGHTWGHTGVAVKSETGWLLHAGDAYFYREEMNPRYYKCTPGLRFYQRMMEVDRRQRLKNQRRLRALIQSHRDEVRIFSAHDYVEFQNMATERPPMPAKATKRSAGHAPLEPLEGGVR